MKKAVEHEPIPMTWIQKGDPLWDELSDRWAATPDLETKEPRRKRPPAIFSKHEPVENGPGWYFRTSWIIDIRSRQQIEHLQPSNALTTSKISAAGHINKMRRGETRAPETWLPLKPNGRSSTIDAMERRFSAGKLNRHEWNTYAGTLRATAAVIAGDDPDRPRCLDLAERVEAHAELSDDAFVRRAMGWMKTGET